MVSLKIIKLAYSCLKQSDALSRNNKDLKTGTIKQWPSKKYL